jgi:lysophospholipase L1-like esterase
MKTRNILFLLPAAFLWACDPEFDEVEFSGGEADFSSYVAVGNSLTAGFQSNALRRNKQEVSYPALLADQFAEVGGGSFKQPLLSSGAGIGPDGNAEFALFIRPDCRGVSGPTPAPIAASGQSDLLTPVGAAGPYNNLGIPGAKSYHLVAAGYGNAANLSVGAANPYYVRFADPGNPNETVIAAALRANPTFFTLWIGNNDVLGYALSGGDGADHNQTGNTNPATYGMDDITNSNVFANVYTQMVTALTSTGAEGALANIPDVTNIPYFTTIPPNALELTAAQAAQLNTLLATPYNQGLDYGVATTQITSAEANRRRLSFSAGTNYFVTVDNNLTSFNDPNSNPVSKWRQLKATDYVTLSTSQNDLKCNGLGSVNQATGMPNPLPDNLVLDAEEVNNIRTAVNSYNNTIRQVAEANGLAYVDANRLMQEIADEKTIDGVTFSSAYISGGAFSLDGVHPNTRGYAIIANGFIDAINAKFRANVPKVSVTSYSNIEVID